MSLWRWLSLGVGICILSVAACAPSVQPAKEPAAAGSQDKPVNGGILPMVSQADAPTLDPHAGSSFATSLPTQPAYNPLVRYDPLEPTMTKVEANLASSWDVSPDGKTYTFHLVKGVKFHNGDDFTAADAKFSFDRQKTPEKGSVRPRQAAFDPVDRIEAVDDYTLKVVMSRPYASFLANIAQGWMVMHDKKWIEAGHDPNKEVNGTGPFLFKEYVRGTYYDLPKNPNYWKPGMPYLDGIKYFIITDNTAILAACRTGQILLCNLTNSTDADSFTKTLGDKIRFEKSTGGWGGTFVNMSTQHKPFDDLRIRQALAYAIDQDAAIKVLDDGSGYRMGYMPGKGPWAISQEELAKFPGYGPDVERNRAEAKRLLTEAGYPNGFSMTIGQRQVPGAEDAVVFAKDQWEKIGVKGTIKVTETNAAYDLMGKGDFDIFIWGTAYAFDDPDAIFAEHYTCDAARNYSRVCSPEVDQLFKKQSETLDVETRKKLVHDMEKAALAGTPKVVMPISTASSTVIWNSLHNWHLQPSQYSNRHWEQVWFTQ